MITQCAYPLQKGESVTVNGVSYLQSDPLQACSPRTSRYTVFMEPGDMLDTEGYRGIGLYFYDGERLLPTEGEYGYFLPKEAWPFVIKEGVDAYACHGAEYARIPDDVSVKGAENTGDLAIFLSRKDVDDFHINIDGVQYCGAKYYH